MIFCAPIATAVELERYMTNLFVQQRISFVDNRYRGVLAKIVVRYFFLYNYQKPEPAGMLQQHTQL